MCKPSTGSWRLGEAIPTQTASMARCTRRHRPAGTRPGWRLLQRARPANKSHLQDWTGWDPARVAAVKDAILKNNAGKPDLSVLDKEAVWSDASHRPSSLSRRCNLTHCTDSAGSVSTCSKGVCPVGIPGSAVHAVALVLHNRTELYCAKGVGAATALCPGRAAPRTTAC
eukprot:766177-Hanusia_phi.AAC.2